MKFLYLARCLVPSEFCVSDLNCISATKNRLLPSKSSHFLNSGDEDTVEEEAEAKGRRVRQGSAQEEGPWRRGQEDIREPSTQGNSTLLTKSWFLILMSYHRVDRKFRGLGKILLKCI